jgi:hypothetical protein
MALESSNILDALSGRGRGQRVDGTVEREKSGTTISMSSTRARSDAIHATAD